MYSSVPPPGIYFPRDLVIKVKYGDSLKRFTASVNGNNLDLDIAKLTEKIILAFNLSPSADIILTYADVDGDTVMLDDDEDLRDAAISQKLNPLRINVQLRSQTNAAPAAEPKLNANTAQSLLNDLNRAGSSLEEALKTSPAMLKTLSTVTEDLAKNVPIPILSELLTTFSKLAVSQGVQPANEPSGGSSGSASDAKDTPPAASANATDVFAASETSKETKFCPDKGATSGLPDAIWCTKEAQDYNNVDKKSAVAKEQSKLISEMQRKGKAAAQNASQKGFLQQQQVVMPPIGPNHQNVFPRGPFGPHPGPPPPMHGRHRSSFSGPSLYPFFMRPPPPPPNVPDFPADDAFSSGVNGNMNAPSSNIPPYPVSHPFKKVDGYNSMFSACHVGIACDGCDVSPIVGHRYKSLVKDDYDLCAKCFASFGKAEEYTVMDTPAPRMYRDFHAHSKLNLPSPFCPVRGPKMRSKFESRFIKDVTIPDGTIVAPSTPLTKIWRMRNNGSSVWPFGTQLVWVGGDQLSGRFSYQLEIPVNGLPYDEEVDVAVDFCAPAKAGRYLSYWRLASPSGQKFGQRVWVLFQVEHPDNSKKAIKLTINLNQPPESSNRDSTVAEMTETQDAAEPSVKNTVSNDEHTIDETEIPVIEPETTNVNGVNPSVPPTVSYPLIDLSPTPEVVADPSSSAPVLEVPEYESEDLLLKELEEMGFKQVDLNKEVLRLNKYDLEQSVEDLCGFTEWDPLLDELKEMGFDDKEKNKKLLLKNGGSIKRVVMDLVTGGKAE